LALFTEVPIDQPEAEIKKHAVYHEDLAFKIGESLIRTIEESLKEPIIPISESIVK